MSKFTLLSSQHVDFLDDKSRFAATIVVDKAADLPEPDPSWAPGSLAMVPDDSEVYMLNNEREWKKWQ